MYRKLEQEHINYIPNKYFKIVNEIGEEIRIPINRYLLNRQLYDRKNNYIILFNYDDIYKSVYNILNSSYIKIKNLQVLNQKLLTYKYADTSISKRTFQKYLSNPDRWIGSRTRYQFNNLFYDGIGIDLMHKHGGVGKREFNEWSVRHNNEYYLFHIGYKNKFVVDWICNLFGLEKGSIIKDWGGRMILFDGSGADTNSLQLLHDLFHEYAVYHSTGLELLKNCGVISYSKPKGEVYYDFNNLVKTLIKDCEYYRVKKGKAWMYIQTIIFKNIWGENTPNVFTIKERLNKDKLYRNLLLSKFNDLRLIGTYYFCE